jgi:hypothetical protein
MASDSHKNSQGLGKGSGSRALAAMQRLIKSPISPGRCSHKKSQGMGKGEWEPHPRGESALDQKPDRAGGGAPTSLSDGQ